MVKNGKKVMMVEDDLFFIDLLGKKLRDGGYTLSFVNDGESAISLLDNNVPDIILLDILLPGIDGYEVAKKIKDNEKYKDIPIIFLTNFGSKENIEKGKALGVKEFLIKSTVTFDEIIEKIKKILGN